MKRKLLPCIIGGVIGFGAGAVGGGYFGLVVGGTFLGGFDIYEQTGFEGYELAAYVGAIIGALIITLVGIKLALTIASQTENKK